MINTDLPALKNKYIFMKFSGAMVPMHEEHKQNQIYVAQGSGAATATASVPQRHAGTSIRGNIKGAIDDSGADNGESRAKA